MEKYSDALRKKIAPLLLDGETKLLLVNIANQVNAEIVPRSVIETVLKRIDARDTPFEDRAALLADTPDSTDFSARKLRWQGRQRPAAACGDYFLRVAPMQDIMAGVTLDPWPDRTPRERQREQRNAMIAEAGLRADAADRDAENRLKSLLFTPPTGTPPVPRLFGLPPLARARFRSATVGLRGSGRLGDPLFLAPLRDGCPTEVAIRRRDGAVPVADFMRDLLGLDFFAPDFRAAVGVERTVLGFCLIPAESLGDAIAYRPTPFDEASALRFRGCFGKPAPAGTVTPTGRTADLSRIGTDKPLRGTREIVIADRAPDPDRSGLLVGYLGHVLTPHPDPERWTAQDCDAAFLDRCIGDISDADNDLLGSLLDSRER